MGITEILTLIFVALKVSKVIDFTWVQCFIPEMIAGAFYFIMWILYMVKIHRINKKLEKEFNNFGIF